MTLPTPYYQRGDVTIYHGDCLELLPHIGKVDAVVTDPPYGIDYKPQRYQVKCKKWKIQKPFNSVRHDDKEFNPEHLLKLSVPLITWGGNHYANKLPPSGGWLVWDKKRGGTLSRGFIGSDVELAWTNVCGTAKIYNYMWCGLCREGEIGEHYHPTQKPVNLVQWCISLVPEGLSVCDPYMGSGTTAVACLRTGRRCIGIELEEKYCRIAADRCDKELDQGQLFHPATLTPITQPALL